MKRLLIVAAVLGAATVMASAAGAQSATPPTTVGPSFVDANGDGVCDNCTGTPRGQGQKVRKGKGGTGTGNGTGQQGMGPRDGSGSGRGGGGNCNGTGPKGQGRGRREQRTRRPAARTASAARAALRNRRSIMSVPCLPRRRLPPRSPAPSAPPASWASPGRRAPAVCGTLLLASLGPVSEWLLYHRPAGLAASTPSSSCSGAGLGFLPTYAQSILGGWVFGVAARPARRPRRLHRRRPSRVPGRATRLEATASRSSSRRTRRPARSAKRWSVGGAWRTLLVVALLRLPPNSPFALTNLVMATTGVPRPVFVAGTFLGMLPRTAVAVALAAAASATGAEDIQAFVRHRGPWLLAAGVLGGMAVLGVLGAIARRALSRPTGGLHDRRGRNGAAPRLG